MTHSHSWRDACGRMVACTAALVSLWSSPALAQIPGSGQPKVEILYGVDHVEDDGVGQVLEPNHSTANAPGGMLVVTPPPSPMPAQAEQAASTKVLVPVAPPVLLPSPQQGLTSKPVEPVPCTAGPALVQPHPTTSVAQSKRRPGPDRFGNCIGPDLEPLDPKHQATEPVLVEVGHTDSAPAAEGSSDPQTASVTPILGDHGQPVEASGGPVEITQGTPPVGSCTTPSESIIGDTDAGGNTKQTPAPLSIPSGVATLPTTGGAEESSVPHGGDSGTEARTVTAEGTPGPAVQPEKKESPTATPAAAPPVVVVTPSAPPEREPAARAGTDSDASGNAFVYRIAVIQVISIIASLIIGPLVLGAALVLLLRRYGVQLRSGSLVRVELVGAGGAQLTLAPAAAHGREEHADFGPGMDPSFATPFDSERRLKEEAARQQEQAVLRQILVDNLQLREQFAQLEATAA